LQEESASMLEYFVCVLLGLMLGGVVGFFVDRLIKGTAYKNSEEILKQAQRDAETIRKQQEILNKEELILRREQLEKEMERSRSEIRDQEKRLDRR
jgi:ribonuclease Y